MSAPVPIAVLASGRGSNFEAIWREISGGSLAARVTAVITDNPMAPVIAKAQALGLPGHVVQPPPAKMGLSEARRQAHEQAILDVLAADPPRYLVLAGYMRIMTSHLIEAFRSERGYARIVNVHPSLLPAFPGVESYAQAFQHGAKVTGVTVHLVEREVDSGPICAQEAFSISGCASAEEVERTGLAIEHRLYPATLKWVLPEKFEIEESNPADASHPARQHDRQHDRQPVRRRLLVRPN
jgi:phosphoribosylglycinamide formyltransferase 1